MTRTFSILAVTLALLGLASPALAHHPLAGMPMETLWHGLASGIAHPMLSPDHLFFVIAAGITAVFAARPMLVASGFVAAICAGVLLGYSGFPLPGADFVIALSLLLVGGFLAYGKVLLPVALMAFGLFHGAAFSEALAGQESTSLEVLTGYLIGLAVLQSAIAIAAGHLARPVAGAALNNALRARLSGAVVAGMGVWLVIETVETTASGLLGL